MTTIASTDSAVQTPFDEAGFDEAQLAAASFLARYTGRTLDAYRHDLRGFFQRAADHTVPLLAATRPHIELWRDSIGKRAGLGHVHPHMLRAAFLLWPFGT